MKNLDKKLTNISSGKFERKDFIIADAKDADMGAGRRAPGYKRNKDGKLTKQIESYPFYLNKMKSMTESGLVDIMLMSMTSAERLNNEGLFKDSIVTPAIRLNDTSCIWGMLRNGEYDKHKSRHFATAQLQHAIKFADLGLYSMTFNKDVDLDIEMLNTYRNFRYESENIGMRHFLEVFNSAVIDLNTEEMGQYVNDCILRSLSGQRKTEKPTFLKIAYNGPSAMDELASYDPGNLIVGILGGSKGTTRDCFELISQALKYGARVALFGRKINLAENQELIVKMMHKVILAEVSPKEAVKIYHDELSKKGIFSDRELSEDIEITEEILKN